LEQCPGSWMWLYP